ncbi:hypothetical protein AYK61_13805 [Rhodococcus sp. SBT000017]|uniref:hypothetical protein n=1 Tax=Rhodococcus sp. SBT000017 TaxID=1803385 RepID=UPI000EF8A9C5|nr:hypothetical protein [Rhodococcus sp. SBT000017]RMB77393.1 hypothetical protein AYK61_13805 [Rhodococcus sp. SBT000017]
MSELGAYGLTLPGMPGQNWLKSAPADWVPWSFVVDASPLVKRPPQHVSLDSAMLYTQPRGYVHIDRKRSVTTVRQGKFPVRDAYVHPLLASTALMVAEWNQRLVFHGGAFLDSAGYVWGVLGDREHGKSSFLGWCVANGVEVFSDDLVVTDGHQVLAGPRCIDLRQSAAEHFGVGVDIGVVGTRRRWRVQLDDGVASAPLGGWIALKWGETSVRAMTAQERVAMLIANRGISVGQNHQVPWLNSISAPAFEFRRPQDWGHVDVAMQSLVRSVERFRTRAGSIASS